MRELLDRAARAVNAPESVALDPEVEGAIRSTIGNAYLELGLYTESAEQLFKAGSLLWDSGGAIEDIIFAREPWHLGQAMMRGKSERDTAKRGVPGQRDAARPRAPRNNICRGYLGAGQPRNPNALKRPSREPGDPAPPVRAPITSSPSARPASLVIALIVR